MSTRVAMVWPQRGVIEADVLDVRAEPHAEAELVDQSHQGENVRVLGERGEWRYVQGPDLYFGWIPAAQLAIFEGHTESHHVAVLLADVRAAPDADAAVIARFPSGTPMARIHASQEQRDGTHRDIAYRHPKGWRETKLARSGSLTPGFVAAADLVDLRDMPNRYPTASDVLATAEAFIGVPYLWGGTTALGIDCSGFVQQVYRLNGVALPRDADQQAMLGRRVDEARAGDLFFFGAESVTHVALATGSTDFSHAPMTGGFVEHGRLGGERELRGIRRYLPDVGAA